MIDKVKTPITYHSSLVTIIIIAAVLRIWGLGSNPPHLTNDEAALGYNAYSILKTGKDEHASFLPVVFQSFGDWKPGLYVYLTVPSVAVLGLNEFATRLPGALSGIAAVFLLYLVVQELFKNRAAALFASFFLAVSPWHLQFSRGAWEAGLSLTLLLLAVYLFLRALRDKPGWLPFSAGVFGLTLWAYQGAKLSSSIALLALVFAYREQLFKLPKNLLFKSALVGLVVASPIFLSFFQGKTGRLEVFSVFSYPRSPEYVDAILVQGNGQRGDLNYLLFHSEPLNFARGVLGRWFNHFSGRFLLFAGDANPRHSVPNAGVILLLDAIFLVSGLVVLSRLGKDRRALFLWSWLLLAPLPAALSRDAFQAVRAFGMVAPLTIILALGANALWGKRKTLGKLSPTLYLLLSTLYLSNFVYYLDQYWVHAPSKNSQYWHYGYKQLVQTITPIQDNYESVVIQQSFDQPYIFFLFYQKYPPFRYQKITGEVFMPNPVDVGLVSGLDNIQFREINWSADRGMSGNLFVLDPNKIPPEDYSDPDQFEQIKEIRYLNGATAFWVVGVK